ncbi:MAG: lamin tail domain-containing protein, partial [Flavobacteriales bacterium]|nr:lamin tail domain-containing protein [Flavobacteriales bacterium]
SHLQWGTAGFTLGTGTIVSNVTSSQTISGITPATNYEVYYQDTCTGLGTSSWVGPVAFSTTAAPFIADMWRTASNEIKVAFSDSMNVASATNTSRYAGIANLSTVTLNATQDTATLSYSASFADGQRQTLIVDSIQSKAMLYLDAPDTLSFIYNSTTPALVISEIMYNDFSSGDTLEYLEIYNNGTTAVELGGLFFEKGITLEFAPQTLAAGAYQLLAVNANALQTVFGVSAIQWTAGGLSNDGEDLLMLNSDGDTIDYVNYDDVAPWPSQADGGGYSLVLCNMSSNNSIASSWNIEPQKFGSSNYFISPGAANTCSPPFIPPYRQLSSLISVDSQGVADSAGVRCYTVGVVASENFSTAGASGPDVSFFLIEADNSAGITAISFNAASVIGYDPNVGDSVRLYGKVSQYRGLTQFEIDSVNVLSTGHSLPCPAKANTPEESTESRYIVITGVTVIDTTQWPTSATQDRNVNVLTPAGDTVLMRLDQHRNLYAAWPKAPQGAFDLVGFGSQFGPSSAPFLSGYQVFPSTSGDLDTGICAGVTAQAISNITKSGFTVSWDSTSGNAYFIRYRELASTTWLDSADLTSPTYTASGLKEDTEYLVEIYTFCGCYKKSAAITIQAKTDKVSGLGEIGVNNLRVYPNPVNSILHLSRSIDVRVRNIMGQEIVSKNNAATVDVSGFPSGVYILETQEGHIVRFIKE